MARDTIVDALDRCVEEMQAGTATVEECLARYPQLRAELEPLLSIAGGISTFSVVPDPAQKAAARASFVAALDATPSLELVTMPVGGVPGLPTMTAIADILDVCLDDILAGRATADECLNRYPALRGELEPLLAVSSRLIRSDLAPDPARKLAARARFIEALYAEPEYRGLRGWVAAFLDQAASFRVGLRGAVSMGLALVLATSSGAVYASEQALPGAPLYGVKLAVEQVRVVTAFDEESKAQIELDIASRRLTEVERALELGDQVAVQAAAASYAATIQQADQRLERMGERSQDASARVESKRERQQSALATAVAQAPADSKDTLERARGQAQRSSGGAGAAAASQGSGSGAAGAAAGAPTTSSGAGLSGASVPVAATSTSTATAMTTQTPAPTSSPEPTARREATPEPTETRREEVATAVIRQITAVPTVETRREPTVVAVPDDVDKDDKDKEDKKDDNGGAGQDGNRGRTVATTVPAATTGLSVPTVPPVPTVQQRTAATVVPPPTVAVPTQAAARTTAPLPQVTLPRIGSNSGSSASSNGDDTKAVVAGASSSQGGVSSSGSATSNGTDKAQVTVKANESDSSSGKGASTNPKDDGKKKT